MVMGTDDKSHGQLCECADRRKELPGRLSPEVTSASTLTDVSMTATPSSPMTNPEFAQAGALDLGLEIAAQTFGPTCFSVNGGSAASWVLDVPDTHKRRTQGTNKRLFIT